MKGCVKMKNTRILAFLLAAAIAMATVTSCTQDEPPISDDPSIENPQDPSEGETNPSNDKPDKEEVPDDVEKDPEGKDYTEIPLDPNASEEVRYLRENLPIMDGSTSLIPLEAGLRAKIFGISINEATTQVNHTTTYGSFERLLNKEVDMIFSTPLSEEQYNQAAQKGMDLVLVPIAAEAFVFVVNASNPVEVLTQQQIKDIYSGKITNWKDVGGEDVEIVAFQRNQTSGSQNYIREFMDETPLLEAPTEGLPSSMGGLMDAIVAYDNSRNAIGYSVYAYAADMYGLGDKMKFVKVDGVSPQKETMSDKSYPLTNYNFVIYDKNSVKESTLKMVDWICSDEGQQAIADAGYIPANSSIERTFFQMIGTGKEKPEKVTVPTYKYFNELEITKIYPEDAEQSHDDDLYFKYSSGTTTKNTKVLTGIKFEVPSLTDAALQAEVNAKINEMVLNAEGNVPDYLRVLTKLNDEYNVKNNSDRGPYTPLLKGKIQESDKVQYYFPIDVTAEVLNGYLCVTVSIQYSRWGNINYNYYTETAFFDLYTGKELEFSDIFYKGVDAAAALNEYFSTFRFMVDTWEIPVQVDILKDFTQLTSSDSFAMSFDTFYFNHNNTILKEGNGFKIDLPYGSMVTEEARSNEGYITTETAGNKRLIEKTHDVYEQAENKYVFFSTLPENDVNAEANKKINAYMRNYVKEHPSEDEIKANYNEDVNVYDEDSEFGFVAKFSATEYIGNIIIYRTSDSMAEYYGTILFDATTGERIELEDIFKDGWQENCVLGANSGLEAEQLADLQNKVLPTGTNLESMEFSAENPVNGKPSLKLYFRNLNWTTYEIFVDPDYVIIK